jgi:phage tail-like protein
MTRASDLLGVVFRFGVVIDGYDLGSWSTCKGLAVTFKHEKVKELGEHTTNTLIPGWVEYGTISLQRAMTKSDWDKTKAWLQIVASAPWLATENPVAEAAGEVSVSVGGEGIEYGGGAGGSAGMALQGPSSGKITMFDTALEEVASWELQNVMPAAWKGPQLDANGKVVAVETLDLVHEGFLVCANF